MTRARCTKCGDIVESTHRHDFQRCNCGSIFIDGGDDYCRFGYDDVSSLQWLDEDGIATGNDYVVGDEWSQG